MERIRCEWAKSDLDIRYHDEEWGKPLHDDDLLFEMLILEGMQAGLSWGTILAKRENMRRAFDGFNAVKIAKYTGAKIEKLMADPGIIRNRLKLNSMVTNAKEFLRLQKEYGSFDKYIWQFVEGQPIVNMWEDTAQVPASDENSDRMSKDLKKQGFKFVGTTICYAYMQAVGMINDHMTWCEQYGNCLVRKPVQVAANTNIR